jgi:hypothetical protein
LLQLLSYKYSEVYIVIDALDECIDKNWRIIWGGLLSELKRSVSNLQLLYTSRDIKDIADILTESTRVEIRAGDADIEAYVQAQTQTANSLQQICKRVPELQESIPLVITLIAKGM